MNLKDLPCGSKFVFKTDVARLDMTEVFVKKNKSVFISLMDWEETECSSMDNLEVCRLFVDF